MVVFYSTSAWAQYAQLGRVQLEGTQAIGHNASNISGAKFPQDWIIKNWDKGEATELSALEAIRSYP